MITRLTRMSLGAVAWVLLAGVAAAQTPPVYATTALARSVLDDELPAGSSIVYIHSQKIYTVEIADGQAPVDIGTTDYVYQFARWSPDGQMIATVRNFRLCVFTDPAGGWTETPLSPKVEPTTINGISIEFHPNGQEIIYTKNGTLRSVGIDGLGDRLFSSYHAYDGEPSAALPLATGDVWRLAVRASRDLYATIPGTGDRLFDTGFACSPNVSPDGSYLSNNTEDHDTIAMRDWDGSRHHLIASNSTVVTDGKWDNFHWSNHPDYVCIQGDDAHAPVNCYVLNVRTRTITAITAYTGTDSNLRNPDLFVPGVTCISGTVTDGSSAAVVGAEIALSGTGVTSAKAITDINGMYAIYGLMQDGQSYTFTGTGLTFPGGGVETAAFTAGSMTKDWTVTVANSDASGTDTLPDYFESRHFGAVDSPEVDLGDADLDDFTNLEEYEDGTSPVVETIAPVTEGDWTGCAPGLSAGRGMIMYALFGLLVAGSAAALARARARGLAFCVVLAAALAATPARAAAPAGKAVAPTAEEEAAAKRVGGQVKAKIVWSSSRESGLHDIFIMDADGSNVRALTKSQNVDWFARFSPDGTKVTFCRSKRAWEPETNAKYGNRWNIHIVNVDGSDERELIKDATWGTWTTDGKILFSRNATALLFDPATGEEKTLIDGETAIRKGVVLQQPQISPDNKHVAITLRGSMRETGVFDLGAGTWTRVNVGCQINWFPSGTRMIRMNESTGRGGTEVLAFDVKDGKPVDERPSYASLKFMDLPGKRSHEYFPQISRDGTWMVWCATGRGHDHDIYDYEVFLWKIGEPEESAARLTFHTGNDRWPDIFVESK